MLSVSSEEHQVHNVVDILKKLQTKHFLQKDLHDFDKLTYPKYQEGVSNNSIDMANLNENCTKLTATIEKQENLFRKINIIIQKKKSDLDDMDL